jgi:hypothetical protein
MYRCVLPSSATVKMNNEENMENARYHTPYQPETPILVILYLRFNYMYLET